MRLTDGIRSERHARARSEHEEIRSFSRSLAELEWLLLILVLLYTTIEGTSTDARIPLVGAMLGYAGFVLAFRYANFFKREAQWKLALETWVLIFFVGFVVWMTGKTESPLLILYVLVIIFSALTLGKLMTLLEVLLIVTCYVYVAYQADPVGFFAKETFSALMINFAPLVLVGYVTTMLHSDIQASKARLAALSDTDTMTGLMNMRAFYEVLQTALDRSEKTRRPFALLMIDADNLKRVNDQHGHRAGDFLIRCLARTIVSQLRDSDCVARYGGDEFIALLRGADHEAAGAVAQRVARAVSGARFEDRAFALSSTISIGLTVYPHDATTVSDLIDRADRALYATKRSGRNGITAWPELQGTPAPAPAGRGPQAAAAPAAAGAASA